MSVDVPSPALFRGKPLTSLSDLSRGREFPLGDSELANLIRGFDWSKTALGPISGWSISLRTTVGLVLSSPVPMLLYWGPQHVALYNDGYRRIAGQRHPRLLGARAMDGWPESSAFLGEVFVAGAAGKARSYRDRQFSLERSGAAETFWFDVDSSPVPGDDGDLGGVLLVITETTERVLTDRRVAAEQERQRQMLRQMPGFVGILTGPNLVYEYVNDAYVEISERTEFIGRPFREVFADIAGQGFHELFEGVFHTGQGVVTRGMGLRLHGREETQYVDFVLEPIRDAAGAVTGVFVGGYETTEVYRSEARLRELNADLERQVVERTQARGVVWQVTPDLMGALNSEGYFETSNPAWQTVLGWSEAEVRRMWIFDLVHPDDIERSRAIFGLTQAGQPAIRFPNRYRCKDGTYRWISWVGVPEDGLVYCIGRDITDEKATQEERDQLWTLSEDMLARADYGGGMSAVNPAWTKVLGWSEHELLTNPYADIINPDDVGATVAALEEMGRTGQPTRFENRIRAKDGEWKWIDWTVAPEPDGLNFIAVGRDLSDDKARERELLDTQEALRQSQKMEAVGQLTGGIAHDFNNLLAGISGSLELMQKRMMEQGITGFDRHLGIAQTSAQRAAALTQRLLAFSRRQTLDPKPLDVNRLIAGMEDMIRRTVGPAITVEVVQAGGLWLTKADPGQLENALVNLAINARDAMPDGGRITIETANKWLDGRAARERDLPPGQYISLCVSDTGTGMAKDVISRAFDPFFTTKPLGQGTGLGLSMIHGFVRQSGGQVRIYSEVGQGTTMCLYFPRFAGQLEAEAPEIAEEIVDPAQGETVLVIDDEEPIRMLISDVLSEAGYRILEAGDGAAGLKILQSEVRIDLLITDVGLPGGFNGRQVADAARQTRPDLKVLFVTGYAENAVIAGGHLDPGMQVITKPFPMTALAARVREIIES